MNILEEFYNQLIAQRGRLDPHSEEFERAGQEMDESGALWGELSEKQKKLFGRCQGAEGARLAAAKREAFAQGFRTGAELMLEIFRDSGENACNKRQKEIQ